MRAVSLLPASLIVALMFAAPAGTLPAQQAAPDPLHRDWHASWVTHPTAPLREPLVLHFRRTLALDAVPASYPVRVSADNRFILYVNGQRIGDGPARGDLDHWRYELFDLAPLLHPGSNFITATVWNWGLFAPVAQMTDRTAFLLESEAAGAASTSTPEGWQVEIEPGHAPRDRSSVTAREYMASGPGEQIDAAQYDWNWNSPEDSSPAWVPVSSPMRDSIFGDTNLAHSADATSDNNWGLVPDTLPHMVYEPTTAGRVVRMDAPDEGQPGSSEFPDKPVMLPSGTHVHILLDRKTLTTAYPMLTVSGGKGAKIILTYAEALYDKNMKKGDRDAIEGRAVLGLRDSFLPDGSPHRVFQPLWWRTWRYLEIEIETADHPLTLDSLTAAFTAYPFKELASFHSPDPDLDKIWEISWRTARDDAHETYMDTPYYEQLQYVGDTRIQALISYAVAGDDRLALQALHAFDDSRFPDGITRSRYPSNITQTIPTFSLLWIGMIHDYWMYRPDPAPAREMLPGARTVLDWYRRYENPDGLLRELPWWSFIDWVQDKQTIPSYDASGESCMTTLEYLGALIDAADLEKSLGDPIFAERDSARAAHVRAGISSRCWNPQRGLIAETPDRNSFSQQANILAVLYDVIPKDRQKYVLRRMLSIDPGTTPDGVLSASYYFRYYLARALDHAGMGDDYLASIEPWRKLLALHFSTWPEVPGDTRSDSHAWSAHPIYDMLTLIAGIEPASGGFSTVRIEPHLGALRSLSATYPHPKGEIKVDYKWTPAEQDPNIKGGSIFHATITLPAKLTGTFVFNGKTWPLEPGENHIDAPTR